MLHPVREHIPIYLAAIGPKNLELAGEIADGWQPVFFAPGHADDHLDRIKAGRAKAGKDLADFDISATVPIVVGDDVAACADPVRPYAALYIGGMGSRDQNFYNALAVRMGYEEAAAKVQDLYLARDYDAAIAAVPQEFVDATVAARPGRTHRRPDGRLRRGRRHHAVAGRLRRHAGRAALRPAHRGRRRSTSPGVAA